MNTVHRVSANGVSLAYQVLGNQGSPPMVLLHALGERGENWVPVSTRFAEHHRVYALDLRGHGESDWPGGYSSRNMCEDVLGVLDQLDLERVILVGHSLGGAVGYLLAMKRPERVERLVIEDAVPPFKRNRTIPEQPGHHLDFDWAVVPAIIGEINAGDPAAWEGLGMITAPTLLIGGGPTSHIPQDKLTEVTTQIPCCELVTIPAGHEVHAARPLEFAQIVIDWLRR